MNDDVRALEPKSLWNHFSDLNAVPRPSKKEERVIEFAKKFGESLNLETIVDQVGNVIIKKPASPGMENLQTIVMQSHLDMVHQKNNDTDFDFNTQGIQMYVDDDWVKAKGTTLGADNGIGVASIMAILSSNDIKHPAIEALFTIDEETGMTGAQELKGGLLKGSILLNLDTEDDKELTIGCAGGVDITVTSDYKESAPNSANSYFKLTVKGLTGGHSGMDIILGRGNANKLVNRILLALSDKMEIFISDVDGGGLRNAIPRESNAILAVETKNEAILKALFEEIKNEIVPENTTTDPNIEIVLSSSDVKLNTLDADFQFKILRSLASCQNGIYRMSPDIEGLVQTSNNLARVEIKNGKMTVLCLTRSSVDSEKKELARSIKSSFELSGSDVNLDGSYPGWAPKPQSDIVEIMADLYRKINNSEPDVNACHAGLECGILGTNYPDMDMISFGPNIRGAHSPDEKVQISSVQKYWDYLLETLQHIPKN